MTDKYETSHLEIATATMEVVKEMRRARRWSTFWRNLFRILWFLLALILVTSAIKPEETTTQKHIAVIEIKGVIDSKQTSNADDIIGSIKAAHDNDNVVAIFLDINSPGGSPVQSSQLFRAIRDFAQDKKIYAVIGDTGASGAYYIAAAANEIYADPASVVGSIGVISTSFGYSDLADKIGIVPRVFTSGEHKNFLGGDKELDDFEVAHMNNLLQKIHRQFRDDVVQGRGDRLTSDDEEKLFSGLFWTGEEALKLGLIDGFASKLELQAKLFGKNNSMPLVIYSPKFSPLNKLQNVIANQISSHIASWFGIVEQTDTILLK